MTKDNKRLTVRVFFREYQPCMALGVPNTEAVNCTDLPVRQGLQDMFSGGLCRRDDVGEARLDNGDDILRAVGYKGFEHPRLSEEK